MVLLLILFVSAFGYAQEFTVYDNGLIYDKQTMARLGKIVDSLNLKFKRCELAHPYYSLAQGFATSVNIPNTKAMRALKSNVTLEAYLKQFPQQSDRRWVVRGAYTNYEKKQWLYFKEMGKRQASYVELTEEYRNKNTGWIITGKTTGLYLHDIKQSEIAEGYGRMVQYVDCMIDTTTGIFAANATDHMGYSLGDNPNASKFMEFVDKIPGEPQFDAKVAEKYKDDPRKMDSIAKGYLEIRRRWREERLVYLDNQMKTSPRLRKWLEEGTKVAINTNTSTEEFEIFVARYISKETALQLKRGRRVVGQCSMDSRPRNHAVSICILSAETARWDVFLRSHLDIMNDNFERMSDGSWAWQERQTYLRELEELDIDAIDLLLGSVLSVDNVSDKHYFGSVGRIGRALAEASEKEMLEHKLREMINDPKLDPLNRIRMASVYANYSHNLTNPVRKQINLDKLNTWVKDMPAYLQAEWNLEE